MIKALRRGLQQLATSTGWPGSLSGSDSQVGYDAIKDVGRRRPTKRRVYPQDRKLGNQFRERAIATNQDLQQNFATAAWAIRRHLDYVSTFVFQCQTDNDQLNKDVEQFIRVWSIKQNCDIAGRHSFPRMVRMAEARRTVDGDFGFLKVSRGPGRGKLQAIEGYRIQQPQIDTMSDINGQNWVNGVQLDKVGRAIRYAIHSRSMEGILSFDRFIRSRDLAITGYYERFDQVRGISPMLPALNLFTDVYEGVDMGLAKMKVNQLFALAFFRDAVISEDDADGPIPTEDADSDGIEDSRYEYDFGSGPQIIDMEPGDRAEFLESKTIPTETVEFLKFVLSLSVKCLDLPDSFLWEDKTNFFGSRAALNHYLRSAAPKVRDLTEMLDEITAWRLGMAVSDGIIDLPDGMEFRDLMWEWTPKGSPWWNPVQEVSGAKQSMAAGLDNIERLCKELGTDVQTNIDTNAKWRKYSKELYGEDLIWASNTSAQMQIESEIDSEEPADVETEDSEESAPVRR